MMGADTTRLGTWQQALCIDNATDPYLIYHSEYPLKVHMMYIQSINMIYIFVMICKVGVRGKTFRSATSKRALGP